MIKTKKGFYNKTEKQEKKKAKAKAKKEKLKGCDNCRLNEECHSPKMGVFGKGKEKILIINENPTIKEDNMGKPYLGLTGKMLQQYFAPLNLMRDCWYVNAVRCHKGKDPTIKDMNNCRVNLHKTIAELKPEKIITLGKISLQTLIGDKVSVTGIEKWLGWKIPDQVHKCWIYPVQSPKYVIANEKNVMAEKFLKKRIKAAIEHDESWPDNTINDKDINIINDCFGATIYMQGLAKMPFKVLTFDYETTGVKPHRKGHKIKTISFATDTDSVATAFPYFPDKDFKRALMKLLQNPKTKKVAHNISFEDSWTKTILKYQVKHWHWDTMIAEHVIDNRSGITGLKFQVYVRYGVPDYDKTVAPFLDSGSKNKNDFNKIDECPVLDLLRYNAEDSYWTMKLYKDQQKELKINEGYGLDLLHQGAIELAKASNNGICVDSKYYEKQNRKLLKRLKRLSERILENELVQSWDGGGLNSKGKQKDSPFNFNSDAMLRRLLFEIHDYAPSKQTLGGKASVDAEALSKLDDIELVQYILKWKKLDKIQNTYLAGFIRETIDGVLRPGFNLHVARTFRSSSSNPNFQNIPKRDKKAQKIVRTGIRPRPGRQILEVDYSGIEVCISACYHKDPAMIKYIKDPETDMHRDQACEIFIRTPEEVIANEKELGERYLAKNKFVFAQFYGDWFKSCATALWESMKAPSKKHLRQQGIRGYAAFEKHIEKIEKRFWERRFKVYNKWKIETWKKYQRQKYLKSYTGFIYSGNMKKNDALNYCIQGSAFHCLLWSLIQISRWLEEEGMKTLIIGQIHDSIVLDVVPEELDRVKKKLRQVMCHDIKKHFDWIIVPLDIEADITEIDGNWAELKSEPI